MKLIKTLKILLITQLFMVGWLIQITQFSRQNGEFDGLMVIFPIGIFIILGVLSIFLYAIYKVRVKNTNINADGTVTALFYINIAIAIFAFLGAVT